MCRLKRWPPKSPWRNIHSQEPRAPKSCSIRAPIRAPKSCSIRVPDSGPEKSIETVASKEPLEKHPKPRAPGRKVVRFGPRFGPRKAVPFGSRIRAPKSRIPFGLRKDGWWTQMCKLKQWHPKSPSGPRKVVRFGPPPIRAPIRAPKSCSIRVPDSGPEKSYTIRAPKRWLVDTNVQIETVASKEPPEKHPQPRAPGHEKLFDSGPDSVPFGSRIRAPKSCLIRAPIWAPKSCSIRAPIRAPKSCSIGSRIRAPKSCSIWAPGSDSKLFSSWKNSPCWPRRLVQNLGRVQAPKLPQREQGAVAQWQRARTNLWLHSW